MEASRSAYEIPKTYVLGYNAYNQSMMGLCLAWITSGFMRAFLIFGIATYEADSGERNIFWILTFGAMIASNLCKAFDIAIISCGVSKIMLIESAQEVSESVQILIFIYFYSEFDKNGLLFLLMSPLTLIMLTVIAAIAIKYSNMSVNDRVEVVNRTSGYITIQTFGVML